MAYTKLNLKLGRGSYNSKNSETTLTRHSYRSATDNFLTILTANYFPDNLEQPEEIVKVGDVMELQDSTNEERVYIITALAPFTIQSDSGNLREERLTHVTAFGGVYASPVQAILELRKVGTMVTCGFPLVAATASNSVVISETIPIPSEFAPTTDIGLAGEIMAVVDNGAEFDGYTEVGLDGSINIYKSSALNAFSGSGITGFKSFYMSWISD